MAAIDLDGVSLMDLSRLAGITEGKGSAAQKVGRGEALPDAAGHQAGAGEQGSGRDRGLTCPNPLAMAFARARLASCLSS